MSNKLWDKWYQGAGFHSITIVLGGLATIHLGLLGWGWDVLGTIFVLFGLWFGLKYNQNQQ